MSMGIPRVLALVMNCRQPRSATFGDAPAKFPHQPFPLYRVKFPRQSQHDFLDHAGVLPVPLLLVQEPPLHGPATLGHVLGQNGASGAPAQDVPGMRRSRALCVCAAPHATHMQAVNRHPYPCLTRPVSDALAGLLLQTQKCALHLSA